MHYGNQEEITDKFNKKQLYQENKLTVQLEDAKKLQSLYGKIDFIVQYECYFYLATDQKDQKPFPSLADIFTYDDCRKIIEYIKNNEATMVIYRALYERITEKFPEEWKKEIRTQYDVVFMKKHNWILLLDKNNTVPIHQLKEIMGEVIYV